MVVAFGRERKARGRGSPQSGLPETARAADSVQRENRKDLFMCISRPLHPVPRMLAQDPERDPNRWSRAQHSLRKDVHTMDWLRENWFFIAVVILFVWFHTKMHGGHGGHGGHGDRQARRPDPHAGHRARAQDEESRREREGNGGAHAGH